MHITYDLPVTLDDIQTAKKDWPVKFIKPGCRAQIILANAAKVKYS